MAQHTRGESGREEQLGLSEFLALGDLKGEITEIHLIHLEADKGGGLGGGG